MVSRQNEMQARATEVEAGSISEGIEEQPELRHAASRLSLIARVTQAVVASMPLDKQMQSIAEQVRQVFDVDGCVIRGLEEEGLVLLAASGMEHSALPAVLPPQLGIAGEIMASNRPLAIRDVASHPITAELYRKSLPRRLFRAYAGVPLLVEGRISGILGVYMREQERDFSGMDLEHLQIVAGYAAVARENDRLYRDLRAKKEELEARIQERQAAAAALHASEARFQAIFENAFDAVAVSQDGRLVYCNPAYVQLFGYSKQEDLLGLSPLDLVVPLYHEAAARPGVQELRCRRADGTEFVVEAQASAYVLHGRTYVAAVLRDVTERKRIESARDALLRQQQRIAQTLQRALLLAPPEDAVPGLQVRALCESATPEESPVGGDFFDIFPLSETLVALVAGDVAGKGLAAAAETVRTKFALRALLREHFRPDLVLERLNHFLMNAPPDGGLADETTEQPLVALALAVVDAETGLTAVATAGSEPVLRVRSDGAVERIVTQGILLRAEAHSCYDAVLLRLEPGDTLVLMTDGIAEARRGDAMFSATGLDNAVRHAAAAVPPGGSLEGIGRQMVEVAREFAGGLLRDDVCLVFARREGDAPAREGRLKTAGTEGQHRAAPAPV